MFMSGRNTKSQYGGRGLINAASSVAMYPD